MGQCQKYIEDLEADGGYREEIDGDHDSPGECARSETAACGGAPCIC
jgi:hypothetical protein